MFQAVTALLLCPWTFFNLTRSKYLQLFTTVLRNVGKCHCVCMLNCTVSRQNDSLDGTLV